MDGNGDMKYTITKKVDKDLAGVPAKLVLHFEEGSALEITMDQIVQIKPNTQRVVKE